MTVHVNAAFTALFFCSAVPDQIALTECAESDKTVTRSSLQIQNTRAVISYRVHFETDCFGP